MVVAVVVVVVVVVQITVLLYFTCKSYVSNGVSEISIVSTGSTVGL